ncbi:MAG: LOG family protein [Leptospiraceae bacterium]|nr:LOG family protein [Leptospiraceae bacterium]MCP5494258.1 LOG family protein [Leptospiraceae bacterium]
MNKKSFRNIDYLESEDARDLRILSEYNYPHSEFIKKNVKDTIVMFGSARIKEASNIKQMILDLESKEPQSKELKLLKNLASLSNFYDDARELSKMITEWGIKISNHKEEKRLLVCTGGGPGIMEAGNRGAKEAGGTSVALNISLPLERTNPYTDPELSFDFHYFFMRKLWFLYLSKGVVVFPGGFGTIDELFETLTLIQTNKNEKNIPILLYGKKFWEGVINFSALVEYMLISENDMKLIHFVDSPIDAFNLLKENVIL